MHDSANQKQPWYRNGLRFACTGCGRCCTGEPGYVWVDPNEISAMAEFVGTSVEAFEKAFVRRVGRRRSLIELPGGDCTFFDGTTARCRVYAIRPRQCRTWPFWPSNILTPETWDQVCRTCPGAGRGRVVPLEEIDRALGN